MKTPFRLILILTGLLLIGGSLLAIRAYSSGPVALTAALNATAPWEQANPLLPLPTPPMGIDRAFDELPNPPTPERVRLGRWLFFDKRLSANGTISCATCHQPSAGFSSTDAVATGIGGKLGTRKPPPILNLAFAIRPHQFWDGRAASLEEQALAPVMNPAEMGNTHEGMLRSLSAVTGYAPYFQQAFGDAKITPERVAKALSDYERTRLSGRSAWDRWQAGDAAAVSDKVKLGHQLFFFGKAACNRCHLGPTLSDSSFHNLGVGWDAQASRFKDPGRYEVTKNEADRGAFKTPTLREVARRAPYFHDGSAKTLREVVEFYNAGGRISPNLDPAMKLLGLTNDEMDALVALLESFNGEGFEDSGPSRFPE